MDSLPTPQSQLWSRGPARPIRQTPSLLQLPTTPSSHRRRRTAPSKRRATPSLPRHMSRKRTQPSALKAVIRLRQGLRAQRSAPHPRRSTSGHLKTRIATNNRQRHRKLRPRSVRHLSATRVRLCRPHPRPRVRVLRQSQAHLPWRTASRRRPSIWRFLSSNTRLRILRSCRPARPNRSPSITRRGRQNRARCHGFVVVAGTTRSKISRRTPSSATSLLRKKSRLPGRGRSFAKPRSAQGYRSTSRSGRRHTPPLETALGAAEAGRNEAGVALSEFVRAVAATLRAVKDLSTRATKKLQRRRRRAGVVRQENQPSRQCSQTRPARRWQSNNRSRNRPSLA